MHRLATMHKIRYRQTTKQKTDARNAVA